MEKLFNAQKFKKFIKSQGLKNIDVADAVGTAPGRISEICNGLLPDRNIKLLEEVCKKYNIDLDTFYGDYEPPSYMVELRNKIKIAEKAGIGLGTIAENTSTTVINLQNVVSNPSFNIHINNATEILKGINRLLDKHTHVVSNERGDCLMELIGHMAYKKLLAAAENNFEGNVGETLKYIINNHFYK